MALIQIRDVPERTYETIRRRAREAGQSIQSFMLARTIEIGDQPSADEVVARIERRLAGSPPVEIDTSDLLADVRSGRVG